MNPKKIRKREIFYLFLIILIMFSFMYRTIPFSKMLVFGDSRPFSMDPQKPIDSFFSIWMFEQLGYPYIHTTDYLIIGLIEHLYNDPILLKNIVYLLVLPLAVINMFIFLRYFFEPRWYIYLTAIIYAVNPVTIGAFVHGHSGLLGSNLLWFYAGFPLIAKHLFKLLQTQDDCRKNRLINILILVLLIACQVQQVPPTGQQPQQPKGTYKVGVMLPLTGDGAAYGLPIQKAAKIAMLSISEMIDVLSKLGIKSNLELGDYL